MHDFVPEPPKPRVRRWVGKLWAALNCVLVLVVCLLPQLVDRYGTVYRFEWIALVALVSVLYYFRVLHAAPFTVKPDAFTRHEVPPIRARQLQHRAGSANNIISDVEAQTFALAILDPGALQQRVVDEYTPDRRCLTQSVSVELQLPAEMVDGAERRYLVPAFLQDKGVMLDDLRITLAEGTPLYSHSYREQLVIVACVLRKLLIAAYRRDECAKTHLPKAARDAEEKALHVIAMRRRARGTPIDVSAVDDLLALSAPNQDALKNAHQFAALMGQRYAVVISLPFDKTGRVQYRYSRIVIPNFRMTGPNRRRGWSVLGLLRLALGARPVSITVDISNATSCQSYHLHLHGPEGLYLARQVPSIPPRLRTATAEAAPTPAYLRFRSRHGQSHAHFYARYMPPLQHGDQSPRIRFDYLEVPPGSVFRAFVTALACSVIVFVVAHISSFAQNPDSDAPAYLLAFPALAATWLGFSSPTQRIFEGTLSARLCLLITVVVSIAASVSYMLHQAKNDPNAWSTLPDGLSFLGIHERLWAVIFAASLINVMVIGGRCVVDIWQFGVLTTKQTEF
ncbi:hypothetical protein LV79_004082 [Actinokineospora globicatena]|nr:hypothetical protein [Actinokineospora globicatena]GLW78260.1 hypothetical protein Aglo01_27420 [Actinokineospora globicatena]GLW85074.1 hypothetical protein Aglo02_27140 [Actinokineospora globicatena]